MCLTAHILEDVLLTTLLCLFAVDYRPGPPQPKVTRTTKPKVFLTDGRDIPLNGPCLVFTRMPGSANTSVTDQTISKVPVVWCLWMVISFLAVSYTHLRAHETCINHVIPPPPDLI